MDYLRSYKKFFSSHYLYEGIRITAGVATPVIVASYYNHVAWGTAMALGSMAVSLTDNPGPIHHRRNGMMATMVLIFASSMVLGLCVSSVWWVGILLLIFPFLFSMLGVYGTRTASVGTATLLLMALNIDKQQPFHDAVFNAFLMLCGGIWYFLLSGFLHTLRPYKLLQQVLGECMGETAKYLRCKASFYQENVDYDLAINQALEQQLKVHDRQQAVREILFKTRSIVKESTFTGQLLLMAFLDTVDLYERIMTSQQDYLLLHKKLDETHLLESFGKCILQLADDLDGLSIAFQEGKALAPLAISQTNVVQLEKLFVQVRNANLQKVNLPAFISLRQILESIKDLQRRIDTLHRYSSFWQPIQSHLPPALAWINGGEATMKQRFLAQEKNRKIWAENERSVEFERFVDISNFDVEVFLNNLNFKSNIFRHSLRVSIALLFGFVLAQLLPLGHDYWILLTIVVILKPAYSLTKKRNFQRLGGTLLGGVLSAAILFLVKEHWALVTIIVVCMVGAYSLMRTNYFLCVIFMTIYVLLAIQFLKHVSFNVLFQDRLVDTAIGSGICLLMVFLLPPLWEANQMLSLCAKAIQASASYFNEVAPAFVGQKISQVNYRFYRKENFVAMANLGDAFQRMMNEPKSTQQNGEDFHQLVVANHVLASYIASLSAQRQNFASEFSSPNFLPITEATHHVLQKAATVLHENIILPKTIQNQHPATALRMQVQSLLEQRFSEIKQSPIPTETSKKLSGLKSTVDLFELIFRTSEEIFRVCNNLVKL